MNSISITILCFVVTIFFFGKFTALPVKNSTEKDFNFEGSGSDPLNFQSSSFHSNFSDESSSPPLIRWKRDSNATMMTTITAEPDKIDSNTSKLNENEKDIFSLEDVIFKIEESFIKAASDVVALLKMNHSDFDENLFEDLIPPPPPPAAAAAAVSGEEYHTEIDYKTIKHDINEDKTDESENQKASQYNQHNAIPIYSKLSTRSVPENTVDGKPAHISLDRITVYVADTNYFPVIPTFDYQPLLKSNSGQRQRRDLQKSNEAPPTTEKSYSNLKDLSEKITEMPIPSTTSSSSVQSVTTTGTMETSNSSLSSLKLDKLTAPDVVETISTSTVSSLATKDISSSSSTTPKSISSSTMETTKTPIEELKEKEKEVKEKIAEVEAEPIILSSRV